MLEAGRQIGPYELLRPCGGPEWAELWVAAAADGHTLLLLIPKWNGDRADEAADRARVLEASGLACVIDFGAAEAPYVALERMEGTSLEDLIGRATGLLESPAKVTPKHDRASEGGDNPFYDADRDVPSATGPRFEVIDRLGGGGMGQVFRARDRELDEVIALKVISAHLATNTTNIDRMRREVRLARKIRSPRVCRIHDLVELPDGGRAIAMELVDGRTLSSCLKAGMELDYARFCRLGADIAEGLAAAHGVGVIHRDLKPENVMVTKDDRAVILDFGIARSYESRAWDDRVTAQGVIVGTLPYMAPEQLSGGALDPRSDLYALGLILGELCTGSTPFYAPTYPEILRMRVVAPSQFDLFSYDDRAPPLLARLLTSLLDSEADRRPATAELVVRELRGIAEKIEHPDGRDRRDDQPEAGDSRTPISARLAPALLESSAGSGLGEAPLQRGLRTVWLTVAAFVVASGLIGGWFLFGAPAGVVHPSEARAVASQAPDGLRATATPTAAKPVPPREATPPPTRPAQKNKTTAEVPPAEEM